MQTATVPESQLPLQRLYALERGSSEQICMTQPRGDASVIDFRWGETVAAARRIAAYLRAQNWPPRSRIAILAKNSAWWFIADYAIWMAGHVSVPLYHTLSGDSIRQILDHAEVQACFVGRLDGWPEMRSGIAADLPCIALPDADASVLPRWDDLLAQTPPLAGEPLRAADELATIIYTSGTTGMPKGVMHSFGTLATIGWLATQMFGSDAEDRLLSYLPLAHIADRGMTELASLQTGCRVYFAWNLDSFVADLRRARPTVFLSVPRLWTKFQQGVLAKIPARRLDLLLRLPLIGRAVRRKLLNQLGLGAVRVAFSGAAPTPLAVMQWYRKLGLELLEVYGMTENFGISHCGRVGGYRAGYIGPPWMGVDTRLGANGEIEVHTPGLMMGYFRDPERTGEAITADGWLRTGDVGEIGPDGYLKITGRAKEPFKTTKGKYVTPAPIENRLGMSASIESSCVTGASLPQPFALVMLPEALWQRCTGDDDAKAQLERQLETHLSTVNSSLDRHEQLAFLVVVPEQWTVDNGLVTPTLKIKRQAIEARYGERYDQWAASGRRVVWA